MGADGRGRCRKSRGCRGVDAWRVGIRHKRIPCIHHISKTVFRYMRTRTYIVECFWLKKQEPLPWRSGGSV